MAFAARFQHGSTVECDAMAVKIARSSVTGRRQIMPKEWMESLHSAVSQAHLRVNYDKDDRINLADLDDRN